MATFTVTTTADNGVGSLRVAVAQANVAGGPDRIEFDPALGNTLMPALIRLTSGQIEITETLVIDGDGRIAISGDALGNDETNVSGWTSPNTLPGQLTDNTRIFFNSSPDPLTLEGLTRTGGYETAGYGAGGAVLSNGSLSINDSTFFGNGTSGGRGSGGAVYGAAFVAVNRSTFLGNKTEGAAAVGGAIAGNTVFIFDSDFAGNTTGGDFSSGGAVFADELSVGGSIFFMNETGGEGAAGGAIYAAQYASISESTIRRAARSSSPRMRGSRTPPSPRTRRRARNRVEAPSMSAARSPWRAAPSRATTRQEWVRREARSVWSAMRRLPVRSSPAIAPKAEPRAAARS